MEKHYSVAIYPSEDVIVLLKSMNKDWPRKWVGFTVKIRWDILPSMNSKRMLRQLKLLKIA